MNVNKPAAVLAMTMSAVAASAVVAFSNPTSVQAATVVPVLVDFNEPANASAAEQNQPAATKPTAGQCAPISKISPKQVLNLARQSDQPAVFGQLLSPDAIQQCHVTVSYQELRGAISDAQKNQSLGGLAGGLVLGAVGTVSVIGAALRRRERE